VLAHPVVRALATKDPGSQSGEFIFEPVEPSDIDRVAPPEDTPLVLDADSSQRAAIAAAIAGRSFVMDGPPGTGKSQTIANMIGALLHAGRTVLFVSEKAAALEVVRNRLADAGLENAVAFVHGIGGRIHRGAIQRMREGSHQAMRGVARQRRQNSALAKHKTFERGVICNYREHQFTAARFGYGGRDNRAIGAECFRPRLRAVVHRDAMPGPQQTPGDPRAHFPKANQCNFHDGRLPKLVMETR